MIFTLPRSLFGVALVVGLGPIAGFSKDLDSDSARARVMLVLDGSSSMWTRVGEDQPKILVARDTIADLVGGWEAKMEFGITTYGHREEGNCQDIETVLPLSEVESSEVIKAVGEILPRGKTPLADSLRQAAEALDFRNQPGKILLVSDGIENCGQDPCAAAKELAEEGHDLSIDVISLDMNNHDTGQLECIAANANGNIVRAEIEDFTATMDQTMDAAMNMQTETGELVLATRLVHKPVTDDLRYVVYRQAEDDFSPKVAESMSAEATFTLPAGHYVAEAVMGDGAASLGKIAEVEVKGGETIEHVFRLIEFRPWRDGEIIR